MSSFPDTEGRWQLSTDGGSNPVWSSNGSEVFFEAVTGSTAMMAVEVETEPVFKSGTPHSLFEGSFEPAPPPYRNYDVSPDGERFVMVQRQAEEQPRNQIHVALHWIDSIRQR